MNYPSNWITFPVPPPKIDKNGNGLKGSGKISNKFEWQKLTTSVPIGKFDNTALLCGELSNVIVLDFDEKSFYKYIMGDTETLECSHCNDRCHVYFKFNDLPKLAKNQLGLEILTTGKYAIIPPSKHFTGEVYEFNDKAIIDMPKDVRDRIDNLLKWSEELKKFTIRRCLSEYKTKWEKYPWNGNRDYILLLYTDLKKAGATLNHAKLVSKLIFGAEYSDRVTETDWKGIDSEKTWKAETVKAKGLFECVTCKGCNIETVKKGEAYDFALKILEMHHIVTLMDTDEMLVYRDGIYQKYGEQILSSELEKMLKEKINTHLLNEILNHIQRMTYTNRVEFDKYPYEINLKNGIYDGQNKLFKPHDPAHLSLTQLPIEYDPAATCPTIDKFFREVLEDKDVAAMYEFFGFCLYKEYFLKKFFILQGERDNGKTVLLELLGKFLGADNISAVTIQSLSDDKFASSNLFGKLSNVADDIPSTGIKDTGMIRGLSGKSIINAQCKFMNSFQFRNYAKLIFSANHVPNAWDDTDAFYSRVRIIKCPNTFSEEKGNVDIWLSKKLELELSGLLNAAVKGLDRLLQNNKFTNDPIIAKSKDEFLRMSSSVYCFAQDMIEFSCKNAIGKQHLLQQYHKYCMENKLVIVNDKRFFITFPKIFNVITEQVGTGTDREWQFRGIKFKENITAIKEIIGADGFETIKYPQEFFKK